MSRYIDADALKETIDREIFRHDTIDHVFQIIDDAPTIEPKTKVIAQVTFDEEKMREIVKEAVERFKEEYEIEPKRGKWVRSINNYDQAYHNYCSLCREWNGLDVEGWNWTPNFCPNCGAKMTEREDE